MRRQIGHITIDTIGAERPKFTASLVLVHGLWCTSRVWHRLMGYLAHRGWTCHALDLRGQGEPNSPADAHLAAYVGNLNQVIASLDAPPILIGHDLGGLLVLSAGITRVRAVVALAPLLPASLRRTPIPSVGDVRARLTTSLRGSLPPPGGRRGSLHFGSVPPTPSVAEPKSIVTELNDPHSPFRISPQVPALIVTGDRDEVTPPATVETLAHAIDADLLKVPNAGHALPWDRGWEDRVTEIHRWLIRTLGDPLLALLDEEDSQ